MNGVHDMGGMHGFGPIVREEDEPVFHSEWERRAFAITLAMGFSGAWNIDMSRFAREQMPPAEYLATGYYEHWLHGLERLLVARGLLTRDEIDRRVAELGAAASTSPVPAPGPPAPASAVQRAVPAAGARGPTARPAGRRGRHR
jgi:nitrile hydratase beta subunit